MPTPNPLTEVVVAQFRRKASVDEYYAIRELWKEHSKAEDRGDIPGLLATLTDDCVYEYVPGGPKWEGHEGAAAFYTEALGSVPDLDFNLLNIVIGPQGVFQEARVTGTQQKLWLGREPDGQKLDYTVAILFPWDSEKQLFTGERIYGSPFNGVGDTFGPPR